MSTGPAFWDSLCGPKGETYPEYVSPDIWFGEYVTKLEDGRRLSPNSDATAASGSSGTQLAPAKLPRWKRRTPEQIKANKAAQKRFREKKKAKFQAASSKVEELSQQVKSMDALSSEVNALEQQNMSLQADLWQKEAELNVIRMELNEQTPQAAYDEKMQSRCIPSFLSQAPALDTRIDQVAKRWLKERDNLAKYLEEKRIGPQQGSQVAPAQLKEVENRSLAVMAQCMEIMTLGGPQLDSLLRTLADKNEDLMRQGTIEKHAALADALSLSPQQTQQLLAVRTDVTQRLERIYAERQALNMKVMALLMASSQADAGGPGSPAQRAEELKAALSELKQNLRKEQRLEAEHHHAVFRKSLNPIQGAHFIVKAYPDHCDTLAFMHGVAERQKTAQAG